jgi:hypothetical protein
MNCKIMLSSPVVHALTPSGSYEVDITRAERRARTFSAEYLRGYLEHYESTRGPVSRVLTQISGFLCMPSEPAEIVGFRRALDSKVVSR